MTFYLYGALITGLAMAFFAEGRRYGFWAIVVMGSLSALLWPLIVAHVLSATIEFLDEHENKQTKSSRKK